MQGKFKTQGSIAAKLAREMLAKMENQNRNPYGIPEDFKEFAALCQIRSGTEFMPFHLYGYQEVLSDLIDKYKIVCIWKTRQLGMSELVACKMLHQSLLNPAFLGVAFSLGQQESSKLSDRVGAMPGGIPGFKWITDSKTARKADGCGELLFRPSTENSGRSLSSASWLFYDEVGFPDKIESMYGAAAPAQKMLGEKARRILGTTVPDDGIECWFGRTFWSNLPFDFDEEIKRIQEGKGRQDKGLSYWVDDTGTARVLLHWHSHPVYSAVPKYLEKVKDEEKLTEDQLQREHNLGFPKSGGSLFRSQSISESAIGSWAEPVFGHRYLAGLDPNMGGEDSWCLLIFDITEHPFQLVAEYAESNQLPSYCAAKTLELIDQYRPVVCAIEKNNGGLSVAEKLTEARAWLNVQTVNTTALSKTINTDRISIALTSGDVIFPPDWQGIDELKKFSRVDRRAMGNGHDDRVMAWAIGFACLEKAFESHREAEAAAAALEAMS
jgi:hypothetical protein